MKSVSDLFEQGALLTNDCLEIDTSQQAERDFVCRHPQDYTLDCRGLTAAKRHRRRNVDSDAVP